jgi:SSS family transporter
MRFLWSDWIFISFYLGLILFVGWWKGRDESTIKDFIGGGQAVPWWAVLASLVATEISALTFLNVPGIAFTGDLTYLQFGIGTILGRFVVGFLFLTAFYKTRYLTVYSYLADRFGPHTRYAATGLFLLTRLLGSSLRLSLAVVGVSVIFELPFLLTLLLFGLLAVAYTFWGGIKAIMWTDLVQALAFAGACLAALLWLGHWLGGWEMILQAADSAGKTRLFNLSPSSEGWTAWFAEGNLLPLALLNGFLAIIASLGTDQDLTQRLLTCRDLKSARRSVILSGFVGIPIAGLFLLLGLGLWMYAQQSPDWVVPLAESGKVDGNRVFSSFIGTEAPVWLRGVLLIGVFAAAMSSVDSAMGALSSTVTVDLYKPLIKPDAPDSHYVWISRLGVLFFGVVLMALAFAFQYAQSFLWLAFEIASIPAGALLGVFLLGLLTKQRGSDPGNLIALASSIFVTSTLAILRRTELITLDWTWLIGIGLGVSFGLGVLFTTPRPDEPETT